MVPKVRRVIEVKRRGLLLLVMDCIYEKQLAAMWGDMSDDEKEQVVWTLRGYVQQLREVDIPRRRIPGYVDEGNKPTWFMSPVVFNDTLGKFTTQQDLVDRMNEMTVLAGRVGWFDASKPLVLTHHNLDGRNVIVDAADGKRLWLIDGSESGFFPEIWEGFTMLHQLANGLHVQHQNFFDWRDLITVMCGESPAEEAKFLK